MITDSGRKKDGKIETSRYWYKTIFLWQWRWSKGKLEFVPGKPFQTILTFTSKGWSQGDQMFLWKNCPKTMKNCPKSRPTMCLLDLLYKTVLWCFMFDFMPMSNGTGHSFIVVFLHKKGDIIFWIFLRHVKNLFWNKIFALLRSILGDFFMAKILPKSLGDFFKKKFCPTP